MNHRNSCSLREYVRVCTDAIGAALLPSQGNILNSALNRLPFFTSNLQTGAVTRMRLFGCDKFRVCLDSPGRLLYREGNSEYTFPVYESNRQWILVDAPTLKRIRLFFGWYRVPFKFPENERERILPRLVQYLASDREAVRIFDLADADCRSFSFYPELFDQRSDATDILADAGIEWLASYTSIDLLHEEYGLEVCGIQQQSDLDLIAETLSDAFPHWHHCRVCYKESE